MKLFHSILFIFLIPFVGLTQPMVQINNIDEIYVIENFDFYIDSSNTITIEEINTLTFTPKTNVNKGLLHTQNNIWVRIKYKTSKSIESLVLMIDQANFDTIELHQFNDGERCCTKVYGNDFIFTNRKYQTNHFIFDINQPVQEGVIYIKFTNHVQTSFNVIMGEVTTVLGYEQKRSTLFAIIMGVFGGVLVYSLFIYLSIKEPVYLAFIIQTILTALLQAVLYGFTFQFIWPNNIYLQEFGKEFLTASASTFGLVFMILFLKLKELSPRLYKISLAFIFIYIILSIWVWFDVGRVNNILLIIQPVLALFFLFSAIYIWGKGYKPAKLFLISWIIFLIGIVVYSFAELGIVERNNFTTLTLTIGAALQVVFLSLALANRINDLKREQELAVSQSLKLEREKAAIILEQNINLEKMVLARTIEIETKGLEMEAAYTELKETQSQLVNSEKMSSLGQLTAGIAHEINNPINFVSANITPLRRDVNDVVSIFEKTEKIAKEGLSTEAFSQIENLKKSVDYQYLKHEINELLDGLRDGAERTVEIVRGLKLFARVDEEDLKKVDLEEGLKSTLILLNSKIKHRIELVTHYSNIPKVECYGGKMNQVFMNVIGNAIDAINIGGVENGKITIGTSFDDTKVKITIKDNGLGMTDEVKNKLFEPFFTTKEVGFGTGLGLSIAYKLVEKHNGNIKVNSVLNEGTEFVITLPISIKTKPPTYV